MKRMIAGLMVGALCAALFASPAVPSEWDPNYPPPTPYMHNDQHTGNCDLGSLLLDHGADPSATADNDLTPSAIAEEKGYLLFVKLIEEHLHRP